VSVIAHGGGLAAELAAVPAASCVAWPGEVDVVQCAALPIALVTVHHALAIHRLPGRGDRARYAGPSRIAAGIEAGSALSICAAACIATMSSCGRGRSGPSSV
jgi:NADPH:quinone reductase-like Zn-dependent oxidoreductase